MANKIENISCPECSKPLLAIETLPSGEVAIHSYGCNIEPGAPSSYAVCVECGGRAAFPANLLTG